jgi:hypothetical protein
VQTIVQSHSFNRFGDARCSEMLATVTPESRTIRTLLPAAPTGVAMAPRTTGVGNRDRFELNGKIGLHWREDNSALGMPPVAA